MLLRLVILSCRFLGCDYVTKPPPPVFNPYMSHLTIKILNAELLCTPTSGYLIAYTVSYSSPAMVEYDFASTTMDSGLLPFNSR